jgi:hypothetical protein
VPIVAVTLQKGILVNFLSPHAYIFWLTVGGPSPGGPWRRVSSPRRSSSGASTPS